MCDVVVSEDDMWVVSFVGFWVESLRVFLGRIVGISAEMIVAVRFDGLCMFVMLVGLGFSNLSGLIRRFGVAL
jgi:hypothetical protein